MALTAEELKELQLLEIEEKQGLLNAPTRPAGGLSPEEQKELLQLERELEGGDLKTPRSHREAELGFIDRARYHIEPIESNRKALLVQEFGAENVATKDGETYIKQDNEWRPVNAEGVSTADFAELAGSAPEMLGAGAGAVVGMGVGSVPSAMAGAGAGSIIRQGVSGALGTPQVATAQERLAETALSAGTSGVFAGIGKMGKWGIKKAVNKARKALPGLDISDDGRKLMKIAKMQKIDAPTTGQKIGGRALELEKALGEKRFFGAPVRGTYEKQAEQIKANLKSFAGEFVDVDPPVEKVGKMIKDKIGSYIEDLKTNARYGFDDAVRIGEKVTAKTDDVQFSLLKNFQELGLYTSKGQPLRHSSKTGLTSEQFKRLQSVAKTLLDDVKTFQKDGVIDANSINTMRKFVDANIRESQRLGFDDMFLIRLKNGLLQTTEDMLGTHSKEARDAFINARYAWRHAKEAEKLFTKGGKAGLGIKDLSDEKVLKKIFTDSSNVKKMTQFLNEEEMNELGVKYVNSILSTKLGGADQIGAQGALTAIKRSKPQIIASMGEASYNNLRDNLHFLAKIGKPINPSRTALMSMRELSIGNFVQGLYEAGELTLRRLKHSGFETIDEIVESITKKKGKAIGGLQGLADEWQREQSEKVRGPFAPKIPYRRY